MWFGLLSDLFPQKRPERRLTNPRNAADRRRRARRLLLEGLEDRSLMAFDTLTEYATGVGPYDLLLADVNADTHPDMIVANSSSNSVEVRLGNADGSFAAASTYSVGGLANSVAAGDLDGDGAVDLVVTDSSASSLKVLKGNGNGTFQSPLSLPLPPQPIPGFPIIQPQFLGSVAIGDLNEDGKLDLVATGSASFTNCPWYCYGTYGDEYVNVLLGNGNGSGGFAEAEVHALNSGSYGARAGSVAIGDINNDGDMDVATVPTYGGLAVLLGDGTGDLGSPTRSGYGSDAKSISLGDVDGDGDLDSLSINGSGVNVQKGDGAGGFTTQTSLNVSHAVDSAVMGDVNDDGKLDLVVAGGNNGYICINGGSYGCYEGYWTTSRQVSVLLGNGAGEFSLPLTTSFGVEPGLSSLADVVLTDLTGDDLPEVAVVDYNSFLVFVAVNDGNWVAPTSISISDAAIVVEGNSGTVNAVFTVTINGDHGNVSVRYAASDANAIAGEDFVATSGTLTFSASEFTKTIVVPVKGDTLDEYDEQFVVGLSNLGSGLVFIDSLGVATIQDDDEAPLVTINDVSKNEGNRNLTPIDFTVTLSKASGKTIYIEYSTADGTARTDSNDYYATNGTLYFAPGMTTATINTSIRGDTQREPNETFFVNLTNVVDATVSDSQGQGTIVNDDGGTPPPQPTISIGDASVVEGNSGTKLLSFTLSLSASSSQNVQVNYKTTNGSAKTSDNDYVSSSGTILFAPGQMTKTITVTIKGDTKQESNEKFYINLSSASGATIADGQGVGTILNDDVSRVKGKGNHSTIFASAVDAVIDDWMASTLKKRVR